MSGKSNSSRSKTSGTKSSRNNASRNNSSKTGSSTARKKTSTSRSSSSAPRRKTASSTSTSGKKKLTVAQRRELERQQQITQILVTVACMMLVVILVVVFILVYDRRNRETKTDFTSTSSNQNASESLPSYVYPASTDFMTAADGEQLKKPSAGEEVAVLETSMGKIKIRLFPAYAPTAVESFKKLITSGSYDGVIFHRVIDDFMIQGGRIDGVNCAFDGYSTFQDEFSRNLYNFRGALSMANGGANTNGTQFFIVQTKTPTYGALGGKEGFLSAGGAEWAAEQYEKLGGTPYLDGQFRSITGSGHTVFGQVYEGMKVVDKIAAVKTDENDQPLEDVVIKKAYLETVK